MQSCLGIYIQDNIIKYAKVSKDHNNYKVEAYGVKFYDLDIEKVIDQIIKETFSYKIPISININKENYTYSNLFKLLKQQDLEKAIDTEFEFFCNNNGKNKNATEYRKIKTFNLEDRDKIRVIYTYTDKVNVVERLQMFDKYKINNMSPIATTIQQINRTATQDNCVIVNIEQQTEITTLVNGRVYKIDKIENGMGNILKTISEKESSVKKAYEICKNTTVYTRTGQNLKIAGNEYLEDIITVLFDIISKVRETISNNGIDINNIYITGMGIIINNLDLLFQESFIDKKCEILVPYFVEKTSVKINIKDYIEVNSAIALALQGLQEKKQANNFTNKGRVWEEIVKKLNSDVKIGGGNKDKPKRSFKETMKARLDTTEKMILRGGAGVIIIMACYIVMTDMVSKQINQKIDETDEIIASTQTEISRVLNYARTINSRVSQYENAIASIDEATSQVTEDYSSKNAIPNLLTRIGFNVPKGVQLLAVENSSGKNIEIRACAEEYDQLGYFKAALEEEGILVNITTSDGRMQNDLINITISGELPY